MEHLKQSNISMINLLLLQGVTQVYYIDSKSLNKNLYNSNSGFAKMKSFSTNILTR